jgi:2-methylcitrate dehydratase PrpD
MSVLRDLAAFVCGASIHALPESERTTQRRHVADTLVAAVAGAQASEGRALRAALPRDTVPEAIGLQAAVIRYTEIDDIHTPSCTTPSSVTVPTGLLLARASGDCDPERVASAIWVGTELMTRLGAAIDGARILYRGIWPTYFTAPLACAAIAARIGRLTEEQTAQALSLALMLTAGRSSRFQGALPGRSVILSLAIGAGIRAADAAQQGVGGDPDLLDGPWLRDAQGLTADLGKLTRQLGKTSCYTQMSLKPFCSAKQAVASVEGVMALMGEGIAPAAVQKVTVRVPPPYARMIATKTEAGARSSSIVSAPYQIGLAVCRPERLYDIERADAMAEKAVLAFAAKVEIVPDETLLDAFPGHFPAEVEVTADGATRRKRIIAADGDAEKPLDDARLRDKAQRVLAQLSDTRSGADLIDLGLAGLQDEASCRKLADAMWNTTA